MSTTFVTALLSVRANMTYTELGKGKDLRYWIDAAYLDASSHVGGDV